MATTKHTLQCLAAFPYATARHDAAAKGKHDAQLTAFVAALKAGHTVQTQRGDFEQAYRIAVRVVAAHPFFSPSITLVPVPTSSPHTPGAAWPGANLAGQLAFSAAGRLIANVLSRSHQVRKSSKAPSGAERVKIAEHVASLRVDHASQIVTPRVVLVDDVVTQGTQFAAAAIALRRAGYKGEIGAFAAARSLRRKDDNRDKAVLLTIQWANGEDFATCTRNS